MNIGKDSYDSLAQLSSELSVLKKSSRNFEDVGVLANEFLKYVSGTTQDSVRGHSTNHYMRLSISDICCNIRQQHACEQAVEECILPIQFSNVNIE